MFGAAAGLEQERQHARVLGLAQALDRRHRRGQVGHESALRPVSGCVGTTGWKASGGFISLACALSLSLSSSVFMIAMRLA